MLEESAWDPIPNLLHLCEEAQRLDLLRSHDSEKSTKRWHLSDDLAAAVGPDAPMETNSLGARQSALPYRFQDIDPLVLLAEAQILGAGAAKYGVGNWKGIDVESHLNHVMSHVQAFRAGDRSDDHLGHARVRLMMALVVERDGVTPQV